MGLGVLYRAALPKRSLGGDIAVEDLWQQVSAVIARLTSERGSPIAEWFWSHAEEEQLWLHVVPFEENIEFRIEKGLLVVSAKTSGAGPGYHEFVVEVLDSLENEVGLRWNHGEDEGDETGFREARHSGELRRAMAVHARALAGIVVERAGQAALLNMGLDFRPTVRGFAASPLGEWSKDWFDRLAAAPDAEVMALAEPFFPWWNSGLTGDEFAKFGMVLCWNDVRWVPPEDDSEAQAIGMALHCFERARALGTRLELPELAIAELRRLLGPEASEVAPGPEGLGYRRGLVSVSLPGAWELELPGYFHEAVEEDGGTLVYWFGPRTIRASTLSFTSDRPALETLASLGAEEGQPMAGLQDGIVGISETRTDSDAGGFVTHVTLVTANALCSLTFAYRSVEDREWALDTARSARRSAR